MWKWILVCCLVNPLWAKYVFWSLEAGLNGGVGGGGGEGRMGYVNSDMTNIGREGVKQDECCNSYVGKEHW